jgi:saccharopine dehydrogenase-like NADP-dependent oxidoreductase
MLAETADYHVTIVDKSAVTLAHLPLADNVARRAIDVDDSSTLVALLRSADVVVAACSWRQSYAVAAAALRAGCSFFDLSEDRLVASQVMKLAREAGEGQIFVPLCGLAPGFIGILGAAVARKLEVIDAIVLRAGALPRQPEGPLGYALTWSTDGLVNEYSRYCDVIREGARTEVPPLTDLESVEVAGFRLEAFHTSGGIGTLCDTLGPGVSARMDYKTLRYPGHCVAMQFLFHSLRLRERLDLAVDLLEHALPRTQEDVVLVDCIADGRVDGRLVQHRATFRVDPIALHGRHLTAIEAATASSVCTAIDLIVHAQGQRLPGLFLHESLPLDAFLANRFAGPVYQSI